MATKNEWLEYLKLYKQYIKVCKAFYKLKSNEVLSLQDGDTDLGPGSNPPPPPPPPPPH